jgi:hypothetical protein
MHDKQRPSSEHPSSIVLPLAQSWTAQTGVLRPRWAPPEQARQPPRVANKRVTITATRAQGGRSYERDFTMFRMRA